MHFSSHFGVHFENAQGRDKCVHRKRRIMCSPPISAAGRFLCIKGRIWWQFLFQCLPQPRFSLTSVDSHSRHTWLVLRHCGLHQKHVTCVDTCVHPSIHPSIDSSIHPSIHTYIPLPYIAFRCITVHSITYQ